MLTGGLLLSTAACSDPQRPYPVRGTVLFQNKAAEGAVVTFVPIENDDSRAARPSAIVGPDGTFRLSSRGAFDGAPPGHYAVTIFYLSPEKKQDGQNAGPDQLKGKFNDPRTTPLKVEVKAADNDLDSFRLP